MKKLGTNINRIAADRERRAFSADLDKAALVSLFLLVIAGFVAGCASVKTPSDALGAAYIAADALAVTTHELCGNTEPGGECAANARISTETKNRLRDELTEVAALLHHSRELLAIGEEASAMDSLTRARFILRTAETILTRAQE